MMGRERERLYITVPNLFRCPISLDVMKSPVSLCTGVTYDRSSIQRWLESGHDTCPATMQLLPSKDLVPNLTLRRLIALWASQSSSVLSPLSQSQFPDFIRKISSGCDQSLSKLAYLLANDADRRRFAAGLDGFVEALAGVLSGERVETTRLELAIKILSSILVEDGVREKLNKLFLEGNRNGLISIVRLLQDGDVDSRIQSVAVLEAISFNDETKRIVTETPNLVPVTLQLINQNDSAIEDAVLSLLICVSTNKCVKTRVVEHGIIGVISGILNDKKKEISAVEKSLKLLSSVAACKEGRRAISEEGRLAGGIVERLMKVSTTATEDGVLVLWGMCCWFKCGKVQDKVVRSNGLTKVLLVMQSVGDNDEGGVRRMCGDLLKVLKAANSTTVGTYETNTTHIMPC